jgi:hypothetical protein
MDSLTSSKPLHTSPITPGLSDKAVLENIEKEFKSR